ncbi:MAG: sodium:solute symporter [Pirellulaceae bacterium]|jgi:SSS family transporter|nr:sodium:solute symporter [Pirellulaceae bacterium]
MPIGPAIATADAVVLLAYLAVILLVGCALGRGQRNVTQYLVGNRNLPSWAILGSIVATETSTATFLSVPGLAFAAAVPDGGVLDPRTGGDLRFLQLACGMLVGRCLIVWFLLPLYFRGELLSAYEVLALRFGGATRTVASLVFLVARNVGDGLRLFLAALVLEKLLGLALPWCVVILGTLTIVYTFAGGIKSVIWNDCIQLAVYLAGAVLVLTIILQRLPAGWTQLWSFAQATGKLRLFDASCDFTEPFTFWSGLVGGAFLSLGTHGTDQLMVQRYLCARSQRGAGRALIASGIAVLAQFALFLVLGIALACYYSDCISGVAFTTTDRVLTTFIVDELPRGLGIVGMLVAAVFAAAMSTLSSSLNSSASVALQDFYRPWWATAPTARHLLRASRAATVFFGAVQIAVGIAARHLATAVVNNVLAIASVTAGLLLGIFALGVLTRRVGQQAALMGLTAGVLALTYVLLATRLAYTWHAVIGAAVTFGTGLAVSYLPAENRPTS